VTALNRSFDVVRVRGASHAHAVDRAAIEEPLEVRLHGHAFAVIMRTPGADAELAAGFLLAEGVIGRAVDVATIAHVADASAADGNIVDVTLADVDAASLGSIITGRRQVTTTSACGMCGRRSIESLASAVPRIDAALSMTPAIVSSLPARLRERQAGFDETGGLHAAGLFDAHGECTDVAEDVGRHNAVDKVVGRALLRNALPLSQFALCVSGRTSFEIVQKAVFAGIPIVAAVSAPSSLAVDLARELGVTLIGFVRGDGFNIYTHAGRIT
jgi:FdhD protein